MPAALNYFEYDIVQDEFDGRLFDDLPEARYLGRLVQDFAAVHGNLAPCRSRSCRLSDEHCALQL
jgi:hypothetical protein